MRLPGIFVLLVFALLLPCLPAQAQTRLLEGLVLSQADAAPVPFATLGIRHQPLGSVADAQGRFRFAVPAATADTARLIVSCVGYEPATVLVGAFRAGGQRIGLRPAPVSLGGVTVRPGRVKTKTFGRTGAATFMTAALYTEPDLVRDELAKEQGTILRLDRECLLRDVNFHVVFNRFAQVRFRLNLYSVTAGRPDQPLLHQDGANLFPAPQALAPGVLAGFRQQLQSLPSAPDSAARTQARLLHLLLEEPQLRFPDLAAISAPTLVLAGQYDVIREVHTRAIAQYIPGARLEIFAGASHTAPQEIPGRFNQTVLDFLLAP